MPAWMLRLYKSAAAMNTLLWSLSLRTLDPQGSFALSIVAEAATKKEKHFKKAVFRNFAIFAGKELCWNLFL